MLYLFSKAIEATTETSIPKKVFISSFNISVSFYVLLTIISPLYQSLNFLNETKNRIYLIY